MLEPDEGKLSRPVLRAGGGSNPASLTRRRSVSVTCGSVYLATANLGLAHGMARRAERSRRNLDCLQYRGKHRPGLLPEKPLSRAGLETLVI